MPCIACTLRGEVDTARSAHAAGEAGCKRRRSARCSTDHERSSTDAADETARPARPLQGCPSWEGNQLRAEGWAFTMRASRAV